MLKIRITYIDDEKGNKELVAALRELRASFKIINESKKYTGRGTSTYANIYLDVEERTEE